MCHAIPAKVVEVLPDAMARVDVSGARKTVSTALVGDVASGDYLLIHVGYALGRIDQDEARETLRLLEELGAPQ
jgi:hydrogenase expression/formation protein HypC